MFIICVTTCDKGLLNRNVNYEYLYLNYCNTVFTRRLNEFYLLACTGGSNGGAWPPCHVGKRPECTNKNSSGDEIAHVNFLTTISHTRRPTSKYRKRDKPTSFNKLDDR